MGLTINPYRFAVGGAPVLSGALAYYTTFASSYTFTAEAYDTDAFHDLVTNANRLTIPGGPGLIVRSIGQEYRTGTASPTPKIRKNGADFLGGALSLSQENIQQVATGPLSVSAGDYFTLGKGTGGTENYTGGIWLGIEVLPSSTKYATVSMTANQALSAGVSTALIWDNEVADVGGWHDNATNNTRLTVPSGVTRVKLVGNTYSTSLVNTPYNLEIKKNGATVAGGGIMGSYYTGQMNLSSAVLEVAAGDYFELIATSTAAQTVATNNFTWFSIFEVADYARALVKKVATQSVTSGVEVALAFGSGSEVYDTNNIHDTATNNTRFTVPAGFTKAKVSFSVLTANATGNHTAKVAKNGSWPIAGLPGMNTNISGVDYLSGEGAWIDVAENDYFELLFTSGSNQTLPADDRTWFSIELL